MPSGYICVSDSRKRGESDVHQIRRITNNSDRLDQKSERDKKVREKGMPVFSFCFLYMENICGRQL